MELSLHSRWQVDPSLSTWPSQVPLQNGYEALDVESQSTGGVDVGPSTPEVLPRSERPTPCITTTSTRKKSRVIIATDFLLKGREGPICQTDLPLREVCCLPGTWVKDAGRRPLSLAQPLNCYPLLVFHVGGHEARTHSPRVIKRNFKALWRLVRESGAQLIFLLSPSSCG